MSASEGLNRDKRGQELPYNSSALRLQRLEDMLFSRPWK